MPGPVYSFVSMSTAVASSIHFLMSGYARSGSNHAALAIDARMAREMGAMPALYSMASEALCMGKLEESVHRAFPLTRSGEMQVHFETRWPDGTSGALVAIITLGDLSPEERALLKARDVMCVRAHQL